VEDRFKIFLDEPMDLADHARFLLKLRTFWRFAEGLGRLSCCKRLGVGCIVIRPDLSEVLSIGFNGPPAGVDNDSCTGVEGACGCVHAEGNALAKLKTESGGLIMMTTTLQCTHCAGLVVNSRRVRYVVYGMEYRDPNGVRLLRSAGLEVIKAESVGIVPEGKL
jgi:deoxycytidylate deaminase